MFGLFLCNIWTLNNQYGFRLNSDLFAVILLECISYTISNTRDIILKIIHLLYLNSSEFYT